MTTATRNETLAPTLLQSLSRQLGVTDEVTECMCCGKNELARTVVFETTEDWQYNGGDQFVFFGTTCAKKRRAVKTGRPSVSVNKSGETIYEQIQKFHNDSSTKQFILRDFKNEFFVRFFVNQEQGRAIVSGDLPSSVNVSRNTFIPIELAREVYKQVKDAI